VIGVMQRAVGRLASVKLHLRSLIEFWADALRAVGVV
jgi:hypothetical protein